MPRVSWVAANELYPGQSLLALSHGIVAYFLTFIFHLDCDLFERQGLPWCVLQPLAPGIGVSASVGWLVATF